MRKRKDKAPLARTAITIAVTVAVCVAILHLLQQRQTRTDHLAGSDYLSAKVETGPSSKHTKTIPSKQTLTASVNKPPPATIPPRPERQSSREPPDETVTAPKLEIPVRKPSAKGLAAPRAHVDTPWRKTERNKALAPLLSYQVSKEDIKALKSFVKLTFKERFSEARVYKEKLRDPVAKKFARWYYYRKKATDTEASEIIAFLEQNPLWPDRKGIEESIEDALFWREESPEQITSYFVGREPVSGVGLAALGIALIEQGRRDEGIARIRKAWRLRPLTPAIERRLRKLKVLNKEDHRARAGYLLLQDNKNYIKAAKRILPLIGKKWRKPVKAHIATVKRAKNAGTLLTLLDKKLKTDPAILFARIQWLRRAGNEEKARKLLLSAPQSAEQLIDPEEWWEERQRHIRVVLNEGDGATAYALASGHGEGLDHWDLSDAEFLAGWIAFRFQKKLAIARKHFLAAAAAGGLPKRRSRAAYWLGRVEAASGNHTEARARFAQAAKHYHTFYGQLSQQMINGSNAVLTLRTVPRPAKQDIEQFVANDVMKAMVIAQKAEFENLLALFMYDLAREIDSTPQMILLCELASRIAPRHRTVRMAKVALNRDFPVEHYAYPRALPEFDAVADGQDVETALIHALTRQESEFNPNIVSSAGAVGLMQLLPSTAKLVARRHKVKFRKSRLSSDPAYNVSLGSAFLHQLISNYDGSYIMALAGYNAGPGRVQRWVKEFGDPRHSKVDPIDWIERIPFTETRNYVHKILESAQVYRSRLLDRQAAIKLVQDLHRGRKDKPKFIVGGAQIQ